MKKSLYIGAFLLLWVTGIAQKNTNTLLWRISGNHLSQPSYLFGTIHMLCADDIQLSDSLKAAITASDKVYLELDLDNLFEMIGAMQKMKMRNDTTLADLLSAKEYDSVKLFFNHQSGLLPFSVLETLKPMLATSTIMQQSLDCDNEVAMEQLIMAEAKRDRKSIAGLETMAYQISIFDSIPYKIQAKQLVSYVQNYGKKGEDKEVTEITNAYRNQDLAKLEELTEKEDAGMEKFTNLLLYNRNKIWTEKLKNLLPKSSLLIAVGAGHLPGEKGVINLLRKAGYTVEPVENKMLKLKERVI